MPHFLRRWKVKGLVWVKCRLFLPKTIKLKLMTEVIYSTSIDLIAVWTRWKAHHARTRYSEVSGNFPEVRRFYVSVFPNCESRCGQKVMPALGRRDVSSGFFPPTRTLSPWQKLTNQGTTSTKSLWSFKQKVASLHRHGQEVTSYLGWRRVQSRNFPQIRTFLYKIWPIRQYVRAWKIYLSLLHNNWTLVNEVEVTSIRNKITCRPDFSP